MVETYAAFRERLQALGFILFGGGRGEMLELGDITRPGSWHSGEPETDPWDWKDRLAASRDGAYVRVLDGRATLMDRAWIPVFWAAFRQEWPLEERYEAGLADRMTLRMHGLFEQRPEWARHELTDALDIGAKQKAAFTRALVNLQREMAIVICGQTQRVAVNGMPMGWPSMAYMRTEAWALPEWRAQAEALTRAEARSLIRARIRHISPQCPVRTLDRLCGTEADTR